MLTETETNCNNRPFGVRGLVTAFFDSTFRCPVHPRMNERKPKGERKR